MTNPVYFTVSGRYRSVVADAAGDSDADPTIGSVSATITFTPLIASGDVIVATDATPRPTGFLSAPIVGIIDPADGLVKLRTTPDAGAASGGPSYVPVRLLADTALLELEGDLWYRVDFTDVVFNNGQRGVINSFSFQAPSADTDVDLITLQPGAGQTAVSVTRIAPTGVRFSGGDLIFTFDGLDIPNPLPLSGLTGPTGPTGASGGTGGTGGTGGVGATGETGATGASGASGGTGGTGLAGQSVSLKGSVATYSALPVSATIGDGYILLTYSVLYVWNGSWPAEGSGLPFVGPAGASGASGVQGATGPAGPEGASGGTGGTGGIGPQGPQGETGATGATGASAAAGGTGGTGGTGGLGASGASGAGATRIIQTLTSNTTTLGASGDYVVYANIATTPEAGDPSIANVTTLLSGDGSDTSTTITDSAQTPLTWTAFGNAKLSTSTKKFGTASISFDGTNSYIAPTSSASFALPGNFTIEFWLFLNVNNVFQTIYDNRPGSQGDYALIFLSSDGLIGYQTRSALDTLGGTTVVAASTWTHVAVCRSGSETKLFINGTQSGSTLSNSTSILAGSLVIGKSGLTGNSLYLNGFLDDFRVTKFARYTSNFTAPTAAFANSYTAAVPPQLSLPTAVANTNMYRLQNVNAETLSVSPQSGQTIDGATGATSVTTSTKKLYISDGASGWKTW